MGSKVHSLAQPQLELQVRYSVLLGVPDLPGALGTWGSMKQEDPWSILRIAGLSASLISI